VSADYWEHWFRLPTTFGEPENECRLQGDGEVREDMKRIHDRIEAIRRSLVEVGIVIRYYPEVRDESQPKTRHCDS